MQRYDTTDVHTLVYIYIYVYVLYMCTHVHTHVYTLELATMILENLRDLGITVSIWDPICCMKLHQHLMICSMLLVMVR